ncbi:MAG: mechanosensitive ion channel family protein [bacterium]
MVEIPDLLTLLDLMRAPLFELQGSPVSLFSFVIFILIVFFTVIISRFVRWVFKRKFADRLKNGLDYTVSRIIHYIILVIGLLVGVESIGLDLSSLAIMFGFLGVGIGFGLQNIAANFVSGLILLMERPIKVGDMVSVGDEIGTVSAIKLRSTRVSTLDNIDIIIPNSTFVEENVINWSHGEEKIRLRVPVGVAYGTDARLLEELLLEVAADHPKVLEDPAPSVLFREFGDSSLNFELRVWLSSPRLRPRTGSELNYSIYETLNENGIEIPFPQLDVHTDKEPGED